VVNGFGIQPSGSLVAALEVLNDVLIIHSSGRMKTRARTARIA